MRQPYWNLGRNIWDLQDYDDSLSNFEILAAIDFWRRFPTDTFRIKQVIEASILGPANWQIVVADGTRVSMELVSVPPTIVESGPNRAESIAISTVRAMIPRSEFTFSSDQRGGQYVVIRAHDYLGVCFGRIDFEPNYDDDKNCHAILEVNRNSLTNAHERIESLLVCEMEKRGVNCRNFLASGHLCREFSDANQGRLGKWPEVLGAAQVKLCSRKWESVKQANIDLKQLRARVEAEIDVLESKLPIESQPAKNKELHELQDPRIHVNPSTFVIGIDGNPYALIGSAPVKKRLAEYVQELIDADGEVVRRPEKLKSRDIENQLPNVRDLIDSQPGSGTRIPRSKLWPN
jgi:hypothetical protein